MCQDDYFGLEWMIFSDKYVVMNFDFDDVHGMCADLAIQQM